MASESSIKRKLNREITLILRQSHIDKNNKKVGSITYEDFLSDKMLIIGVIRAGIPYSLFLLIRDYTPFTENDWANFLDISKKTLQRYKAATENFKPIHSEKIIEMAEVTKVGLDVFGNMDKLRLWLNTPNYALGNIKPVDLLKDSYGKELVLGELIRIDYGILV